MRLYRWVLQTFTTLRACHEWYCVVKCYRRSPRYVLVTNEAVSLSVTDVHHVTCLSRMRLCRWVLQTFTTLRTCHEWDCVVQCYRRSPRYVLVTNETVSLSVTDVHHVTCLSRSMRLCRSVLQTFTTLRACHEWDCVIECYRRPPRYVFVTNETVSLSVTDVHHVTCLSRMRLRHCVLQTSTTLSVCHEWDCVVECYRRSPRYVLVTNETASLSVTDVHHVTCLSRMRLCHWVLETSTTLRVCH